MATPLVLTSTPAEPVSFAWALDVISTPPSPLILTLPVALISMSVVAVSTIFPSDVPLSFLSVTTLTAGYMSIRDIFWPLTKSPIPLIYTQGYVDSIAMGIMLICAVVIFTAAVRRWVLVLSGKAPVVLELAEA